MISGYIDNVEVDYLRGGQPHSSVINRLADAPTAVHFDPGLLRPMLMEDGKKYCWLATGRMTTNGHGKQVPEREPIPVGRLIANGMVPATFNAALPHQVWQRIDTAVIRASRDRLRAWNDLAAANTYGGFDGMSITALIRDTMTDPGDAKVDMDTLSDDLSDSPLFTPDIVPLPIIHAGFVLSQRRLATSRNTGTPLDTVGAEAAGRRCAETLETMTIGTVNFSNLVIGSATDFTRRGIYGFCTQPDRITKSDITAPGSWTNDPTGGPRLVQEIITMIELARAQNFFGPFVLYYGTSWNQYMSRDYWAMVTSGGAAPTKTVIQRIREIEELSDVRSLDRLTGSGYNDNLILVQMTSDTVRAIDGMDWTTVQWEEQGGARLMYRVMGIKVPELRAQYIGTDTTAANRRCGIVHGTTS